MKSTSITGLAGAGFALCGALWAQESQPRADTRETLWRVSRAIEESIGRVTKSTPALLLGRDFGQGIRIPGVGAVFVMSPRRLDGADHGRMRMLIRERRAIAERAAPFARGHREIAIIELERSLAQHQKQMDEANRVLERAVLELERAARMSDEDRVAQPPAPPAAPQPPVPATPALAPVPPEPAPPWAFWFETEEDDAQEQGPSPASVVQDVRTAVSRAIDAEAKTIHSLPADGLGENEEVVVAINFVAGDLLDASTRPHKTLIVRVVRKDIDARAQGSIGAEELQRRLRVSEY